MIDYSCLITFLKGGRRAFRGEEDVFITIVISQNLRSLYEELVI
jgi:hypothetical protein